MVTGTKKQRQIWHPHCLKFKTGADLAAAGEADKGDEKAQEDAAGGFASNSVSVRLGTRVAKIQYVTATILPNFRLRSAGHHTRSSCFCIKQKAQHSTAFYPVMVVKSEQRFDKGIEAHAKLPEG